MKSTACDPPPLFHIRLKRPCEDGRMCRLKMFCPLICYHLHPIPVKPIAHPPDGKLCSQILNLESFIPICQAGNLKRTSQMIEELPLLRKNAVSHSLHGVVEKMIHKGPVTTRSVPFLSRKTVKIPVKLSGFLTVSILWVITP